MAISGLRCLELEYTNPFEHSEQWTSFVHRHPDLSEIAVTRRRCEYGDGQEGLDRIPWIEAAIEEGTDRHQILSHATRILPVRLRRKAGCSFCCMALVVEIFPHEPRDDFYWIAQIVREIGLTFGGALETLTLKAHQPFCLPEDSQSHREVHTYSRLYHISSASSC